MELGCRGVSFLVLYGKKGGFISRKNNGGVRNKPWKIKPEGYAGRKERTISLICRRERNGRLKKRETALSSLSNCGHPGPHTHLKSRSLGEKRFLHLSLEERAPNSPIYGKGKSP